MTNSTAPAVKTFSSSEIASMFQAPLNAISESINTVFNETSEQHKTVIDVALSSNAIDLNDDGKEVLHLLLTESVSSNITNDIGLQLGKITTRLISQAYDSLELVGSMSDDKAIDMLLNKACVIIAPIASATTAYLQAKGLEVKTENYPASLRAQVNAKSAEYAKDTGIEFKFNLSASGKKGEKVVVIKSKAIAAKAEKTTEEIINEKALAFVEGVQNLEADVLLTVAELLSIDKESVIKLNLIIERTIAVQETSTVKYIGNAKNELDRLAAQESALLDTTDGLGESILKLETAIADCETLLTEEQTKCRALISNKSKAVNAAKKAKTEKGINDNYTKAEATQVEIKASQLLIKDFQTDAKELNTRLELLNTELDTVKLSMDKTVTRSTELSHDLNMAQKELKAA